MVLRKDKQKSTNPCMEWIKKNREDSNKLRDKNIDIAVDIKEVWRVIRDYYEQPHVNKFGNLVA